MRPFFWQALLLLAVPAALTAAEPKSKPLATGLNNPAGVAGVADGRVFVTEVGEGAKTGAGRVAVLASGKALPFATGLDQPRGLVAWQGVLFVADNQRVWRIDAKGKATVFAAAAAFPTPPRLLVDITVDEQGVLYVLDSENAKTGGAVYRIDPKGKVTLVVNAQRNPALAGPGAMLLDGMTHLLVVSAVSGELHRIKIADGKSEKIADGFGAGAGLAWDYHGRLYVSDAKNGRVLVIPRPGEKAVILASDFQSVGRIGFGPVGNQVLVTHPKAGIVSALPAQVPGQDVDETPLPIVTALAFPDLQWTGWKPQNDKGQVVPLRPLVLTHAGDGSNRVFVATQRGVVHVFPNDQKATKTAVFLDIQNRVSYSDNQNEEGFLGLTFHPKYKDNGEFFVFYTIKKPQLTNIVARYRVSKDDPSRADPASEEVLLQIQKPFWNHDGGTLCFGPDGYLYIALGDGGAANDPFLNGQNLKTLLGKVLRIDVDRKDAAKNYAIPKDNPFVKRAGARPEIWAYGLRNIWRMAFDRKTGKLWASDVGQNLYEEIDIIVSGGNYGWNLREGLHPFGNAGVGPRPDLIEPIWEYHHDVGKSMTGGLVYRGKRVPELEGAYLYGDYVTSKIWALRYDDAKKRVVANQRVRDPNVPIYSFGEDEQGEAYFMTASPTGKGIYWFVKAAPGKR